MYSFMLLFIVGNWLLKELRVFLYADTGLAYALGNLYRDKFVIPLSEVTGVMLAAFYLQFAELKNECVISLCTSRHRFTAAIDTLHNILVKFILLSILCTLYASGALWCG